VRTQIASNPTASIYFKVKLAADNTHAKIAEAIVVSAGFTRTIISWKQVSASYVSASLVQKYLNQRCLRQTDARM
jgi:pyrroloquinoline quinone (PQQ) biosynthesis protein C